MIRINIVTRGTSYETWQVSKAIIKGAAIYVESITTEQKLWRTTQQGHFYWLVAHAKFKTYITTSYQQYHKTGKIS